MVRKFLYEELINYIGFMYYIVYYEVFKLEFKLIFVRIVFNSMANYMGYILNGYWVKGFNLFDNLLGVLVCFRENRFVFI